MSHQSDIRLSVYLNEEKIPELITWQASDNEQPPQAVKAMLLSMFDAENRDTLKIDLWTKDMQVDEMDRFFFQTLRALADTYYKATQNAQLATDFQRFVHFFGQQVEVIPKQGMENK